MFRFITLCSKAYNSQSELNYIIDYIDSASDATIESIIEVSHREGLLPIVYKRLKDLPIESGHLLSQLKRTYLHIVQKNILFATQLIELTNLLNKNSIDVISIKGPTLAKLAYGDITLRQFGDIDILVRESQIQKVDEILKRYGYQSLYRDGILSNQICLDKLIDIGYIYNQTILLEVHWRLLESKHNGDMALNKPFDSTQSIDINTTTLYTLSNELLLIYVALHGAKHAWSRIGWVCDIDRLVRRGDIEWQTCIDMARESKMQQALYIGLHIAHHLYETPLPNKILITIDRVNISNIALSTIDRFDKHILERLPISKREIFLYQMQLFESKREKFYFLLKSLFAISPADCIKFAIPSRWRFLYIIMRPYRIITKLLFGKA